MTYKEIIAALKLKLEAADLGLQGIHVVNPKQITKYPAAILSPQGHSSNYHSMRDNERMYTIIITVDQSISEDNGEKDQQELMDMVDRVINLFESYTGSQPDEGIEWLDPTQASFEFVGEPATIYRANIQITARVLFNRWN